MACSGLHIPAKENSTIYVFDNIFADIGDEQSIQESLSTFSSHMSNIVEILNNSSSNSLILLDELGSGTDPIEGSSLAISILEKFHSSGCLTICTTHYHELKEYTLVTNGFENASCEFDIENLKPTFKLLIGIPGKSNAFAISKKLGLNQDIIDRAKSFISKSNTDIEELLKTIYDNKLSIEREKEIIKKSSNQIELLRKSLEKQNSSLKSKELDIIQNAKNKARQILLDAKSAANSAIKEISKLSNNMSNSSLKSLNHLRNNLNDSIKDTVQDASSFSNNAVGNLSTDDVIVNMDVYIPNLDQYGTIISLPNKSNQVQVQIGNAKMQLPLKTLIKCHIDKKSNDINLNQSLNSFKSKTIKSEINVIGYNVEEAVFTIDKYLDDCIIAKLNTVRIIHGKGTGTLKNGIHSFLKTHSHVKNFRLGTFGEGETGVSIVELK
ncbi:MAG: hypothetical protein HFJ53_01580 [Clostridia bacterium]|nr:hypothetical protein [Clostridia bacterium]